MVERQKITICFFRVGEGVMSTYPLFHQVQNQERWVTDIELEICKGDGVRDWGARQLTELVREPSKPNYRVQAG